MKDERTRSIGIPFPRIVVRFSGNTMPYTPGLVEYELQDVKAAVRTQKREDRMRISRTGGCISVYRHEGSGLEMACTGL